MKNYTPPTFEADPNITAMREAEKKARQASRRAIRTAYRHGATVSFSLRTLIESGVGVDVIRAVYRKP